MLGGAFSICQADPNYAERRSGTPITALVALFLNLCLPTDSWNCLNFNCSYCYNLADLIALQLSVKMRNFFILTTQVLKTLKQINFCLESYLYLRQRILFDLKKCFYFILSFIV